MDEQQVARFDDAQRRAIGLLSAVIAGLEMDQSEKDISRHAEQLLGEWGFEGWFYPPEVQIGSRSRRAAIWRPPSASVRLQRGQHLMLALGPYGGSACGDTGTTLVFQAPDSPLVEAARACTAATCGYASSLKCVGELFVFARTWAANNRFNLANARSIGHALLPPPGADSPFHARRAHATTWLRRHQVHFLNPRRIAGMFTVAPQLASSEAGARFREVIYVGESGKRILGRSGPEDIGRFG